MGSNAKVLRMGLGSVTDVGNEIANLPPEEATISAAISDASKALTLLQSSELGKVLARVLACATLNNDFAKQGDLWKVDDNGGLSKNYIGDKKAREALIELLGLRSE